MDISQVLDILTKTAQAATEAAVQAAPGAAETAAEATSEASGPIGTLGINLKLFVAQFINFGIILLVLWKWVFTPVAKKLTERTEKIEKAMRDASDVEKQKTEFSTWKETEMTKVRSQTSALITAAQSEALKAKQKILDETKQEQERVINQAKSKIEEEKNSAVREVKSQMADLVTLASEKIIRQKLDSSKDKDLIRETLGSIK